MTHALVYEWQGSDSSLKPLLLTGHQGSLLTSALRCRAWHTDNHSQTWFRCSMPLGAFGLTIPLVGSMTPRPTSFGVEAASTTSRAPLALCGFIDSFSFAFKSPDTDLLRSAIELLLESGKFTPTRTVILALGIDEETGGKVVRITLSLLSAPVPRRATSTRD